jgi:hypothetical protein
MLLMSIFAEASTGLQWHHVIGALGGFAGLATLANVLIQYFRERRDSGRQDRDQITGAYGNLLERLKSSEEDCRRENAELKDEIKGVRTWTMKNMSDTAILLEKHNKLEDKVNNGKDC